MRFFAFYFTNDVHEAWSRFAPLCLRFPFNLFIKPGRHCMITTNLITLDTTKLEQSFVCSHGLFLALLRTYVIAAVWPSAIRHLGSPRELLVRIRFLGRRLLFCCNGTSSFNPSVTIHCSDKIAVLRKWVVDFVFVRETL